MYITERVQTLMRGFMKSYGPTRIKKRLWDEEFSGTHWDFINDTAGDCVYPHLERYAHGGSILDLGCGPGNTANELAVGAYRTYVGVDISEAALEKAVARTERNGRADKNHFEVADFISYEPREQYDVILFRESMYHVPLGKVKATLDRLSKHLKESGVFLVRIVPWDGRMNSSVAKIKVITDAFEMIEQCQYPDHGPMILAFRPRPRG